MDKTPVELANVLEDSSFRLGQIDGMHNAAALLRREAGDAFMGEDDLVAKKLRYLANKLYSDAQAMREQWAQTIKPRADSAEAYLHCWDDSTTHVFDPIMEEE